MNFDLHKSTEVLKRTPVVIEKLLSGLSDEWTQSNEGPETWSPFDVVGHLIHGEKTDWIPRMKLILSDNPDKQFIPFDRFAQYRESRGKSLGELIGEFKLLRAQNISYLQSLEIKSTDLNKTGVHPEFGTVNLSQLLSTWVVHDLNHIAQIVRVMASQYQHEVGPWQKFLKILNQ